MSEKMIWGVYECLSDEFIALEKGEKFLICGDTAKRMNDESLQVAVKYILRHSVEDGPDEHKFQYHGPQGDDQVLEKEEVVDNVKDASDDVEDKPTQREHFVVKMSDALKFGSMDECRAYAENMQEHGVIIIAEQVCELKIELSKKWSD